MNATKAAYVARRDRMCKCGVKACQVGQSYCEECKAAYNAEYAKRPDVVAKKRARAASPHERAKAKARAKAYIQRPDRPCGCGERLCTPGHVYCQRCDHRKKTIRKLGQDAGDWLDYIHSGGKCLLCDEPAKCVDHCHKTGRVRGALCSRCNLFLGGYEAIADNPRLPGYLKR